MVLVGKIALNAMNESIPIHHENLCQICNNLAYDHPNLNGSFKCVVLDNHELFYVQFVLHRIMKQDFSR